MILIAVEPHPIHRNNRRAPASGGGGGLNGSLRAPPQLERSIGDPSGAAHAIEDGVEERLRVGPHPPQLPGPSIRREPGRDFRGNQRQGGWGWRATSPPHVVGPWGQVQPNRPVGGGQLQEGPGSSKQPRGGQRLPLCIEAILPSKKRPRQVK